MKKIDLGQTISILANVGVVAGIVFLAVELRQNNELMSAEARADRRDIAREAVLRDLDYPELRRARRKFLVGEELTTDDVDVLEVGNRAVLTDWQYIYLESREGLLDDDAINVANWQEAFYSRNPLMPAYWASANEKQRFHPAFVEWMNGNIVVRE